MLPADPSGVPHLQEQLPVEHGTPISGEEPVGAPSTGKRERKSSHKEAPKKIYFCAKQDCSHAFDAGEGRRPCYVQNGSFSKGQHKKACGGGYRWLEVRPCFLCPIARQRTGMLWRRWCCFPQRAVMMCCADGSSTVTN